MINIDYMNASQFETRSWFWLIIRNLSFSLLSCISISTGTDIWVERWINCKRFLSEDSLYRYNKYVFVLMYFYQLTASDALIRYIIECRFNTCRILFRVTTTRKTILGNTYSFCYNSKEHKLFHVACLPTSYSW